MRGTAGCFRRTANGQERKCAWTSPFSSLVWSILSTNGTPKWKSQLKVLDKLRHSRCDTPRDCCMPNTPKNTKALNRNQMDKCPTGIKGFDQLTEGGLPRHRTTLLSGSAGTGKTLWGIDFLI